VDAKQREPSEIEHRARPQNGAQLATFAPWLILPIASVLIAFGPIPPSESVGPIQMALGNHLEAPPTGALDFSGFVLGLPFDSLLRRSFLWCKVAEAVLAFAIARTSARLFGPIAALASGLIGFLAVDAWSALHEPWASFSSLLSAALSLLALSSILPLRVAALDARTPLWIGLFTGLAAQLDWPSAVATFALCATVYLVEHIARARTAFAARSASQEFEATKEIASPEGTSLRLQRWGQALGLLLAALLFANARWWSPPTSSSGWLNYEWTTFWDFTSASNRLRVTWQDVPVSLAMLSIGLATVLLIPISRRDAWPLLCAIAVFIAATLGLDGETIAALSVPYALSLIAIVLGNGVWLASQLALPSWIGRILSLVMAFALLIPSASRALSVHAWPLGLRDSERQANSLKVNTLFRLQEHGLMLPGDIVVLHDPESFAEWHSTQILEGTRPDLTILDPNAFVGRDGAAMALAWLRQGRRILSDSFSMGGRWNPAWAIDGGPFFWFVFSAAPADQQPIVDLLNLEHPDGQSEREHLRWLRMHLERARFRRLATLDSDALDALPLHANRRDMLHSALQVAHALRITTGGLTELGSNRHDVTAAQAGSEPSAAALAEAGDLLVSAGDFGLGSQLLREAGQEGYSPALGALARWQLIAGMHHDAQATLLTLTSRYDLRRQALNVMQWLIDHRRFSEALHLRDQLSAPSSAPEIEIAGRIRLLNALGQQAAPGSN
jgi:hypothetical protein